ncbi:putative holin [Mycobacterium conspicuum]|uniref:Uncharacterized protein n=1 Tax=Mycobacterium conspicuum TaxID=44010 RepID=A0A1X1SWV1_9MYCO|nr:putative holin [Mycobacterium conspicuum]ORV35398.1 hypothetical protein AWC00_25580 [Mycobacterium conspicuum]BBZ37285.1 hypothetical protein MCNS_03480 [Mycobacterium conspicuum]
MIPLPRAWLLASAMLIGGAVGLLAGVASVVSLHGQIRSDLVAPAIAAAVGIPSVIGVVAILLSGRRWVTMLGAFLLALAPGWLGVLIALRVVSGG